MKTQRLFFLLSLVGIFLSLFWFYYLSPRPENIRFIHPNLDTTEDAASTMNNRGNYEGLYWLSFETPSRFFALKNIKLRTINCVHSLMTTEGDWALPAKLDVLCDNRSGFLLTNSDWILKKGTTWHFAGSTRGGDNYGVILDRDWREWPLILGLAILFISLGTILYLKLPYDTSERIFASTLLLAALFLRFWFVFILSPPELSLFSDMGSYFQRAWEIDHGIFELNQLFQPVGFTLWSLWIRKLGGFELFNWAQVFFSWGTVLVIYLMVRQHFGKIVGLIALVMAGAHIPQAAMSVLHMAETAYAFLITLTLWSLLNVLKNKKLSGFFIVGFLLSLSFYFKGNHAFFIPAFSLWLLYQERKTLSQGFKKVFILALGCLVVVLPHLVWTGLHYEKPHLGPTAGALNFVEGKCPAKDNEDSGGSRWMSPLFGITGETAFKKWDRPFTDQSFFWKEGLKCVQDNPYVLVSSLRFVYYLFGGNVLWPVVETSTKSWYMTWEKFFNYILLPLTLLGVLSFSRKPDVFNEVCCLMMFTLFFTVWFFKSENRFRVPFDAILIMWGSVGCSWLIFKVQELILRLRQKSRGKSEHGWQGLNV